MTATFVHMHSVQPYLYQMHLHDNAPPHHNKLRFGCLVRFSDTICAWLACMHDCMIGLLRSMFSWPQLYKIVISEFIDIGDVYLPCTRNRMTVSLTTGYWEKKGNEKKNPGFPDAEIQCVLY